MNNFISIRYIYSACIVSETPDVKILHDPWFTEGIYDGSWFHYPPVKQPIEMIGDVDLIYISHVHPDHYDAKFLKEYFSVYGEKEIIIADHHPNHLANKMRVDGIKSTILSTPKTIRNTTIEITPHKTGSISDIDSAISIRLQDGEKEHCILNTNDIVVDNQFLETIKNTNKHVDILLCGYTGAGPYPQTYFDKNDPELTNQANNKKENFFKRYLNLINTINAKANIPFAGKYILGGKLVELNPHRGVADAVEVTKIDPNAVVLDDGGDATINTATLTPSRLRTKAYSENDMIKRCEQIKDKKMSYEKLMPKEEVKQLPLKRLLRLAALKAHSKAQLDSDYFFIIHLPENEVAIINANKETKSLISYSSHTTNLPTPRSEIYLDPRYLFGLLTHVYHWNNAEVGSQYEVRRFPNEFNRTAQSFMDYMSI